MVSFSIFYCYFYLTDELSIAYWIAFGPHGPRAQTPKGEGWRVFFKVAQLFLVSLGLVYVIRLAAKPAPRTMTKEWQEATNEYAKVCDLSYSICAVIVTRYSVGLELMADIFFLLNRAKASTLFTASAAKVTRARASFRAHPPRSKCVFGKKTISGEKWMCWVNCPCVAEQTGRVISFLKHRNLWPCIVLILYGDASTLDLHPVTTSTQNLVCPILCYNQCISLFILRFGMDFVASDVLYCMLCLLCFYA